MKQSLEVGGSRQVLGPSDTIREAEPETKLCGGIEFLGQILLAVVFVNLRMLVNNRKTVCKAGDGIDNDDPGKTEKPQKKEDERDAHADINYSKGKSTNIKG